MTRRARLTERKTTIIILSICFAIIIISLFCLFFQTPTSDNSAEQTSTSSEPVAEEPQKILVPVANWDSSISNITKAQFNALEEKTAGADGNDIGLIELDQLTPQYKLLSVDGIYYLDTLREAEPDRVLTLAQTGVTALSRAMVTKLNSVKDGAFFAENLKTFLSQNDYTHISNEVSFADNCKGGTNTVVLCSDWRMLDTITAIGTDIVELTGNHNNDYSVSANLATIKKYEALNLMTFGGGKDEATAKKPATIDAKNTKITLLGYNQSTSTKANGQGANGSNPGANIYDAAQAKKDIAAAKANGDFVIVDVQYFECYSYPTEGTEMPACDAPISGQEKFFKHFIDLGADMVIGTQAHQPQTYTFYKGKPIYYGLGNLFFDQTYWPGTTRGMILTHYFIDGNYVQTRISPTVYDKTYQTRLMTEKESKWFLNRLANAR